MHSERYVACDVVEQSLEFVFKFTFRVQTTARADCIDIITSTSADSKSVVILESLKLYLHLAFDELSKFKFINAHQHLVVQTFSHLTEPSVEAEIITRQLSTNDSATIFMRCARQHTSCFSNSTRD